MNDQPLPTYLNRGFALSDAELRTQLGAELLTLCQSVTADGRLAPEELAGLKQWLSDAQAAKMPAAEHLRFVIERVLADGKITADEYREVHRVVEAALPLEARQHARTARLEAESASRDPGDRGSPGRLSRIGLIVALAVALGAAAAFFSR
jgi:hypothetical protein